MFLVFGREYLHCHVIFRLLLIIQYVIPQNDSKKNVTTSETIFSTLFPSSKITQVQKVCNIH